MMFYDEEEILEKITATLDNLRHTELLTDVLLVCKTKEFPAHKIVLAASSPYFHQIFQYSVTDRRNIPITGIDSDSLGIILDYIYTGKLNLPNQLDKVEEVLYASHQLQVADFSKHSECELSTRINQSNYLLLWFLGEQYGANYLQRQVECFAALELADLLRTRDFATMDPRCLQGICEQAMLADVPPKTVTSAALSWLRHDPIRRQLHMVTIVPYLRVERLHCSVLHQLWECEPLVHQVRSISNAIEKALKNRCKEYDSNTGCPHSTLYPKLTTKVTRPSMIPTMNKSVSQDSLPFSSISTVTSALRVSKSRSCARDRPLLDAWPTVEEPASTSTSCEELTENDTKTNEGNVSSEADSQSNCSCTAISTRSNSPADLDYFEQPACSQPVLTVLGWKRVGHIILVRSLNLEQSLWIPPHSATTSLPSPQTLFKSRGENLFRGMAIATRGETVYLLGGSNDHHQPTTRVLAYRVFMARLKTLPKMILARHLAGADVLGSYLYVVGGMGLHDRAICQVEKYEFCSSTWFYSEPLPEPRWEMGVASCRGCLFALGGRCNREWSVDCLCFMPEINQWTRICVMPPELSDTHPIIATHKEHIYAIGCHNHQHKGFICCFDPVSKRWKILNHVLLNSKKVLALVPWINEIWVVECSGNLHVYDMETGICGKPCNLGKMIHIPVCAFVLQMVVAK